METFTELFEGRLANRLNSQKELTPADVADVNKAISKFNSMADKLIYNEINKMIKDFNDNKDSFGEVDFNQSGIYGNEEVEWGFEIMPFESHQNIMSSEGSLFFYSSPTKLGSMLDSEFAKSEIRSEMLISKKSNVGASYQKVFKTPKQAQREVEKATKILEKVAPKVLQDIEDIIMAEAL